MPNVLSMLRLLLVPAFLWLLLSRHDGWALVILIVSGVTDYLDGMIARAYSAVSRLGQVLDPLADRLYILTTIVGLAVRGILPWWFVALLILRDLLGMALVSRVRNLGYRALPVHSVGKAATFCLLYAMPLVLLAEWDHGWAGVARPLGWAFAWWGLGLYWVAAGVYVLQVRSLQAAGGIVEPAADPHPEPGAPAGPGPGRDR